jgi:tetratricopeptide (TPR) repeat protein
MCIVSLSHTFSLTGQFEQAFARSRQALDMAMETERPYDLSYAHAAQGLAHLTIGEVDYAIQHLAEALRISKTHEIMLLVPHAARYLGRAYALTGQLSEAEKVLSEATEQSRSQSLVAIWGWCSATLGRTRAIGGPSDEATSLVADALDFARRQGYRPLEAYALRLKATMGTMHGDPATSHLYEAWFREAATLSEEMEMRPELAHCHLGLGELLLKVGRPLEARAAFQVAFELYGSMKMVRDKGIALSSLEALRTFS